MSITPYEEKKYVPSDAVTQAQQALAAQQANRPGEYSSQFQPGLDDLYGQLQSRPGFQYDVNADALYQQVAQNYLQQGKTAMMDTMGQAAALTGGYGNSLNLLGCISAALDEIFCHGKQGLAVGQAGVLVVLPQQLSVFRQGHGSSLGTGLKG